MLKNKFIICYTANNWEIPWGMTQKVMENLARLNRILYIEYQPSFLHCYFQRFSYTKYKDKKRGIVREIKRNLHVYTPKEGLPFNNYIRYINVLNQNGIQKAVKAEINKHKFEDVIFWVFVPYAIDFINGFDKFFTLYHCAGNFSAERNNFLRKKTVLKMEQALVGRSNLVVAQTKSLCAKFNASGKKTFYLPSLTRFDNNLANKKTKYVNDSEFNTIKSSRIGIVGYFNDIFYDTDLLCYLLDAKKDWSFVFIGPIKEKEKKFLKLRNKPNAFFLGEKEPDTIPNYISQVDIGIIPYRINDYMREVSPNKFYEYLACGKPVVSTDLVDIRDYGEIVKIGRNKVEFLAHMEAFLSHNNNASLKEQALRVAQENSLEKYLDDLSELIAEAMNG